MAEAAIFGLNSGLDTADLLRKLVALQRRPIDIVEAKREIENQKLASFQQLKSRLQTFKSIVTTLNTGSRFISTQGTFANNNSTDNNDVVGLTTTSSASSGTHSLVVNSLAKESKLVSTGVAGTSSTITQGTLTITVGSTVTSITIDSSNDSLDGLRLAINNSGADVHASFLNDGSDTNPVRLLIAGAKSGTDNAVSLSGPLAFTKTQTSTNASFVIDGVSITKSSNTVTDVLTGTVINLVSAGSGTITLNSDLGAIKEKISDFVEGYNVLMDFLREALSLDLDKRTGVLFGNFTVQNLQQKLRNTISSEVSGVSGTFTFLSQVGIRTQGDGTLTIDDSDLTEALSNDLDNVSQLFSSKGATTNTSITFVGFTKDTEPGTYDVQVSGGAPQLSPAGNNDFTDATGSDNFFAGAEGTNAEGLNFRIADLTNGSFGSIILSIGVAETLNRILTNLVDTSLNGPLTTEINTSTKSIDDFDDTIRDMEGRLVLFEDNLRGRFINLEVVLGRLNSQRDVFTASLAGIQNLFQNNGRR